VDANERVMVMMNSPPATNLGDSWSKVHEDAAHAMLKAAEACAWKDQDIHHRRGSYRAMSIGPSFGGGQEVWLHHLIKVLLTLDSILKIS